MPTARVRTTVAIPEDLLQAVDAVVQAGRAKSRNEFLALALENQLAAARRAAIDAAFDEMADDPLYQQEAEEIAEEFRVADWEALRLSESAGRGAATT